MFAGGEHADNHVSISSRFSGRSRHRRALSRQRSTGGLDEVKDG